MNFLNTYFPPFLINTSILYYLILFPYPPTWI